MSDDFWTPIREKEQFFNTLENKVTTFEGHTAR